MKGANVGQPSGEHHGAGTGYRCSIPLCWVPILGGICRFGDSARPEVVGDLLVAVTPLTYRQLDRAEEAADADLPVTGVDHADACRLAELVGGLLPTSVEWEWLAGGPQRRPFPWGAQPWAPHLARLRGPGVEYEGPGPVGGYAAGATPQGAPSDQRLPSCERVSAPDGDNDVTTSVPTARGTSAAAASAAAAATAGYTDVYVSLVSVIEE